MFVRSPDGGNDFGYLPKELSNIIRRQAGPIRLLESDLQHIEERHGEQIRQSKWSSADQFISSVVTECNAIYQGRAGSLFLVADIRGQSARNVIVKLSPGSDENNQDFYAVKTAILTRRSFLKSHENLLLWHGTPCLVPSSSVSRLFEADQHPDREDPFRVRPEAEASSMGITDVTVNQSERHHGSQSRTTPTRPIQNHHPPPLPETAMQDNRLMGFDKRDGDSVMEPYKSRKYQVEDLGDEGLKVRVLMPNVEPEQLPTTDIPQDERAETIRQEIAGTNMKDPMHKSAMDKMLGNALEQQEKFNDLAANLNSPVFEPRDVERTNVGNDMTPEPHWLDKEVEAQQQVWAGRGMSSDKAAELQEMADREGLKFADVKKTAPEQGKEQGLDTVERPNYRPFAAHGADKLPEGFSSEVRVAALVVREGARMTPEMPMEGDDFKGWQVNRIFKQDHALFRDGGNRVMVETLNFATQEEAIAAAKKMEKEPADLKTLYEARARSGAIEPDRFDFMTGVIDEKQQEQEQPDKPLKPEPQEVAAKPSVEKAEEPDKSKEPEKTQQVESAGDIAEDMKNMANRPIQAEPLFPQPEASPSPETSREQAPSPETRPPFARKQRPEVLMADQRGKPLIYDHGDKITVTRRAIIGLGSAARERREAVTEKSLLEARARFGEPVRFEGSPAFQMQTIAMAVKHGIELEPATPLGKKLYEKALEVDQSKNRLGPSEKTMNRPRERTKSPSKGMEL